MSIAATRIVQRPVVEMPIVWRPTPAEKLQQEMRTFRVAEVTHGLDAIWSAPKWRFSFRSGL
jgi:hypothetical protein